MEKTINTLKTLFWAFIALAALIVVLFECEILLPGGLKLGEQAQFVVLSLMEVATLAVIPSALYLFKMKTVKRQLTDKKWEALKRYGTFRLTLLGVFLVLNTLLYYITGLNVAYGYMAIIVLIVMPFVFPSKSRCLDEVGEGSVNQPNNEVSKE